MRWLAWMLLLLPIMAFGQVPPPVLRNAWSTNAAATPVQGVDNLSVTNLGSTTNWLFWGLTAKTIARLGDVSNIVAAVSQGETNFNGEASVTNATRMGLVFGKSANTNLLRSVQGGFGILNTNESTNVMFAVDTSVIPSFAGLTNYIEKATGRGTNTTLVSSTNTTSAITGVAHTIQGITGMTTNLLEVKDTNGAVQFAVKSNGVIRVPLGSVTQMAIGPTNGDASGIWFPTTATVSINASSSEAFRVQNSTSVGAQILQNFPLGWAATMGNGDGTALYQDSAGVLSLRGTPAGGAATKAVTNKLTGFQMGLDRTPTNAHFLELGYDNSYNWYFLRSNTNQTGILNATNQPLAIGVNTNADILIGTNHGVTIGPPATSVVPLSVVNLANPTTNLVEYQNPQGTIVSIVKSNGTVMLPAGTANFPSIGWLADDDGTGTGLTRPGANQIAITINGTILGQFSAGNFNMAGNGLWWGNTVTTFDVQLFGGTGGARGILYETGGNTTTQVATNRYLNVLTGNTSASSLTNAEWMENGYDQVQSWFFLRAQKGSSNGTARPLVFSANSVASQLQLNTNGSVLITQSQTNTAWVHQPTNTAAFNTVTPSGINIPAMGANFTNNLGARASLFLSYKMTDAVTGDCLWYLTNFSSGLTVTQALTLGITGSAQQTMTVPVGPNEFGRLVDASGTGASAVVLNSYWILE